MLQVHEKIKRLRRARGWTQAYLAEQAGVPVVYLTPIESGDLPELQRRLLDALGYAPSMDDMLSQMAEKEGIQ